MDALEFAKEIKRMCDSRDGCYDCDLFCVGEISFCEVGNLEKAIPIVEKWSKEHPKVTNLDHFAEELEKLGYKVDKNYLSLKCPVPYSNIFIEEYCCQDDRPCKECIKWWDKEYREKKNNE